MLSNLVISTTYVGKCHVTIATCLFGCELEVCQYFMSMPSPWEQLVYMVEFDVKQIKKALRDLKIEITHRGSLRRKYRVSGLTAQPTQELMYVLESLSCYSCVLFIPCISVSK